MKVNAKLTANPN